MGSYTFKWEHPAEEVFVTGTFDNWTKSEQLAKEGDVFQKTVALKDASQKIYFKYVVDGNWTVNESAPKEADHEGNVNNFITPEDILKSDPAAAFISTVTPQSTTAKMASEQPVEKSEGIATPSDVPGGFPATPNTELDKTVTINPLPAAAGAINPIQLAPGEKVPDVGIESTNEHVKLDQESYEKSDALPGVVAADLPPITSNLIPESSLPVTAATEDVHINTVGTDATTVGLAAQVPLEAKVPEVVKESQEKANVEPEAAAVPEEVEAKAKVEEELKEKVTEAPVTSEDKSAVETGAIATDAATTDIVQPEPVEETAAKEETPEVSPEVPAEVKESIVEAGKSPEAAANTAAVEEKKEVEAELLKEVKPVEAVDEPKAEETKAPVEVPVTSATITDAVEESKTTEEPKVEEPQTEVAKTEAPAPEVAPIDTTVASEAPKADAVDTPVTETDKTEVPPVDAPTEEPAKADAANGTNGTHDDKASEKKKNRFSSFFSRFRHRFSDKN
ncbi:carbohydrate-binding module family 48 protein [Trichoderma virens Gv29-8]|uniref:Carbohydrate-binding module family 48 protein n=1 Tax=Hypocrea virens (strain Gv29-8 / FGSC 10586) TaxID=413071 RepID=G9MG87_HYPVG|nr:carbohydrate-binding module family 48 protein [Trichoderma virens Gv29-8]EHK26537.1 carbohydrate-binding module family 48 protein [Trichoderma virens Gv29-8]